MISIKTNLTSIVAQCGLLVSTNKLNQAIERMSTGYKINHAQDNAAGYSISTDMYTKLSAYTIAEDNISAGMDMVATAIDIISTMQVKASRLHSLSTQARNGTYGGQSIDAISAEANATMSEITRLYMASQYNGISLFVQPDSASVTNLTEPLNRSVRAGGTTMPEAKVEYNGFIDNPIDYTDAEITAMTKLESVSETTNISSGKYSILSLAELQKLARMANQGRISGGEYVLGTDLDLSSVSNWTPIGNSTYEFKGTFNGNGHVIENLTINTSLSNQGLFGSSVGIIKNVGLKNVNVEGGGYTGGLAGKMNNQVINCYSIGSVKGTLTDVGGLVGRSYSQISNSYTEGSVNGTSQLGGLVGRSSSAIDRCYSKASVNGTIQVGGVVGNHSNTITNSYATGDVVGQQYVGGLVGAVYSISNCYSKGNVTGNDYVGGLVGQIWAVDSTKNVQDSISYSIVNGQNPSTTGSFIGRVVNTNNGTTFGTVNITNCQALPQGINLIGGVYRNNGTVSPQNDMTSMLAGISDITVTPPQPSQPTSPVSGTSIFLQTGIYSDSSSQIHFDTSFELRLSLESGIMSVDVFDSINDFLNILNSKLTELGAIQNRLESALDLINVNIENLSSSLSTIRDADIAKVSSSYIRQQILQEASATLLATANQSPAIALQLI